MKKFAAIITLIVVLIGCYILKDPIYCERYLEQREAKLGGAEDIIEPSGLADKICGAKPIIPQHLKLEVPKEKVLYYVERDDIEQISISKFVNKGRIMKYTYISDEEIPFEENEIDRGVNVITYDKGKVSKDGEKILTHAFVGGAPYYPEKNGKWYKVRYAKTSIEAFNQQMKITLKDRILAFLGLKYRKNLGYMKYAHWAFFSTAKAADVSYSPENAAYEDGQISGDDHATWDVVHDQTSGNAGDTSCAALTYYELGKHNIRRGMVCFNTSIVGTVTSASLDLQPKTIECHNDQTTYNDVGIFEVQTYSDVSSISGGMYNDIGDAIDNPTIGTDSPWDMGDCTGDVYTNILLNSTGRGWINTSSATCLGLRLEYDYTDNAPNAVEGDVIGFDSYTIEEGSGYSVLYIDYTATVATAGKAGRIIHIITQ